MAEEEYEPDQSYWGKGQGKSKGKKGGKYTKGKFKFGSKDDSKGKDGKGKSKTFQTSDDQGASSCKLTSSTAREPQDPSTDDWSWSEDAYWMRDTWYGTPEWSSYDLAVDCLSCTKDTPFASSRACQVPYSCHSRTTDVLRAWVHGMPLNVLSTQFVRAVIRTLPVGMNPVTPPSHLLMDRSERPNTSKQYSFRLRVHVVPMLTS